MRAFLTVWFGQMVLLLVSSMTEFAIGFWLFTETGSVTTFALISTSHPAEINPNYDFWPIHP